MTKIDSDKLETLQMAVERSHGRYRSGDDDKRLAAIIDIEWYDMPRYWRALEETGYAVRKYGYLWGVDPKQVA